VVTGQFGIIHPGDFDGDVNAVHHWAGDALLIFGDGRRGARARLDGIAPVAARPGIPAIAHFFHAK
jgi:hypothetical protein